MRVIGLMSGTSMDGVDAVLLGPGPRPAIEGSLHRPYPEPLRRALLAAARAPAVTWETLAELDLAVADAFAETALALLAKLALPAGAVRAVGSHGQTVHHRPPTAGRPGWSLQLGDPNRIAERLGIDTVADFRRRDLAAGGHGAPLVPAFHAAAFGRPGKRRLVLNIGGIANLTVLDGRRVRGGFDTGPGNTLLDQWTQRHWGEAMDRDGRRAAAGRPDPALLERLLADPYFAAPPPKSTGPERFNLGWLAERLGPAPRAPEDVLATLLVLTVESVARAAESHGAGAREMLVCGGGAANPELMGRLRRRLPAWRIDSTAAAGIEPAWVEAAAFAWLARRRLAGRPGNVPAVTGARGPRCLGGLWRA